MKKSESKAMRWTYLGLGVGLSFLVYLFALGGLKFLTIGGSPRVWAGPWGLIGSIVLGSALGWLAWKQRGREFHHGLNVFWSDSSTAILFFARITGLAIVLSVIYFIWDLADSVF